MKTVLCLFLAGMVTCSVAADMEVPPRVPAFAGERERFVRAHAAKLEVAVMPMALEYFEAARKGDWIQAMDLYRELSEFLRAEVNEEAQARLDSITGQAALEVQLALEACMEGESRLALAFGESIMKSLPAGSVYFGGTDPGRGLPALLCGEGGGKEGKPFVLTQSSLINHRYRDYVKAMYGDQLALPNRKDQEAAFNTYLKDAERRAKHDREFPDEPKQLLPGENVTRQNGKVNISGKVAVMQLNGILLRQMFEENPGREFFIEENHPVGWMYPHLTPHGLILKVNREAPRSLTPEVVERDRKFWQEQQRPLIGGWLKPGTPLEEVCAFAERVFGKRDLEGFSGDARFVQDDKAGKMYSQPRGAIGGVYEWRAAQSSGVERERMLGEADFAYRQAFALCPSNDSVVMRYVGFLRANGRTADAKLVAETAAGVDPGNGQIVKLVAELGGTQR